MKMTKVTGNFISVSWVSKLKETARKERASLFELRLTMILLFEPLAKELDFKPPTRELPMKRDGKQPHSELYPQCTTSAKSLWEEGRGQVYPFCGYPHGGVRAMKLMRRLSTKLLRENFFLKWKEVIMYITVWSYSVKTLHLCLSKGRKCLAVF